MDNIVADDDHFQATSQGTQSSNSFSSFMTVSVNDSTTEDQNISLESSVDEQTFPFSQMECFGPRSTVGTVQHCAGSDQSNIKSTAEEASVQEIINLDTVKLDDSEQITGEFRIIPPRSSKHSETSRVEESYKCPADTKIDLCLISSMKVENDIRDSSNCNSSKKALHQKSNSKNTSSNYLSEKEIKLVKNFVDHSIKSKEKPWKAKLSSQKESGKKSQNSSNSLSRPNGSGRKPRSQNKAISSEISSRIQHSQPKPETNVTNTSIQDQSPRSDNVEPTLTSAVKPQKKCEVPSNVVGTER